jgi:PAS domain S-box-containing protein
MEDKEKTKDVLVEEIEVLKRRITEIEKSESKYKQVEEALEKERNLLRIVIDNLPDYIYVKDREGRYLVSNLAHARFLGKEKPELVVGKTVFEFFPRELAEQYAADDMRVIQTGEPLLDREERSVDETGKEVWNLTTKVPLRDNGGKITGLVGIVRDITGRKKIEEELKESEERYRTLVQNLPIAVHRTAPGPEGKFLVANRTYLKMFGFESEEELKRISVASTYFNPQERKSFSEMLLSKGKVEGVELALKRKDGTVFWGSVTARVVYDENGENPYFDCAIIDITDRKRVEEELKESEERYRALVQNVPVAVYRTTPGPKGKFVMANPTCLRIFGFDSEEEIKKIDICDLYVNPEGRRAFSEMLLSKGKVEGLELALKKKDGTVFWGSVTARVVYDKSGKETYFDSTIIDITERKKMEDELKKKMRDLEKFQKVAVDRELRMVELKKKIKELEVRLGKK